MSSTEDAENTGEQGLSGLCELCEKEAAEVECAACGPVRVNAYVGGEPLLLCTACATSLHARGVFKCHKLINISRKLWLPVEEQLGLLKQRETTLNDRLSKVLEAVKTINDNYDDGKQQLQLVLKELRDAIDEREQVLINKLTRARDQQLLSCQHTNTTCTALIDQVTKMAAKACECLSLEACQFAEQKGTLLLEMSSVLEQSVPPILFPTDLTFSLADSVAMVKHQMHNFLILPLLEKQAQAGECVQGSVISKLTPQGSFWLRLVRRDNDVALQIISRSIRDDLERDIIKPVTKATVGQLCCAYYLEDKQWHRARVVAMVSMTHVKICYIDYGNYEDYEVTQLRMLTEKYLLYPFQTIRCCITNDDGVELSREGRWLFNDRTKNKVVHVHIISELAGPSAVDGEMHYLVTVKELGESGADISNLVLAKMREDQKQPRHPIIHRDYRLTQQQKLSATPLPVEAPPMRPASRLNTEAAEFILDKPTQPGILQVPQSTFQSMVGVTVTKTPSGVGKNVTNVSSDSVNATPIGVGDDVTTSKSNNPVTSNPTMVDTTSSHVNVANSSSTETGSTTAITDSVTTTPVGEGNTVITSTEMGGGASETNEGDIVTCRVEDKEQGVSSAECIAMEPVNVEQSESVNEATTCNSGEGCHGNRKDGSDDLAITGSNDVLEVSSVTNEDSSHGAEEGVAGAYDVNNVAPPHNEVLVAGAMIEISVLSDLQCDGTFWSQLVVDEETDQIFCDLMESLQSSCAQLHSSQQSGEGTPLVGSLCAALFSADNIWYRALVEQFIGDKLLVRYMDYGNAEVVSRDDIVPLVVKMKELPFQAFLASISSEEHTMFTPRMCERFSSLVQTNDVFQAKVLSVKGAVVHVGLTIELNDKVISINDDVYLSDFVTAESLEFSQAAVGPKLTWPEQMDALGSPVTPTNDDMFQQLTSEPQLPSSREQVRSGGKSKSYKSSPVTVRKISSSSRRMLRRQSSGDKPSGNKKQQKKILNEDSGIFPSSENWEDDEESLVGGAGGRKDEDVQIFVKGFPPTTSVDDVTELFSQHGNVKDVKIDHSSSGRAWITMDIKGARNAVSQLSHHIVSGGDPRGLLLAESTQHQTDHPKPRYKGQGFKKY